MREKEKINHEGNVDVVGVWGFEGDKTYEDYIKNKFHSGDVEAKRRKTSRRRRKRKRRKRRQCKASIMTSSNQTNESI